MYKVILVPLDGSFRAESILPYVEDLAMCLEAEIILLQVFETDYGQIDYFGHSPEFYEAIQAKYRQKILAYLHQVREEHLDEKIPVRFIAEEGPIVDTILSVAECEDVDLIAMASHGRAGLSHVIYGSITTALLHRVEKPLLLIRSQKLKKESISLDQRTNISASIQ